MFTRNQLRNQKVLVAGCGRFGACLAAALSNIVLVATDNDNTNCMIAQIAATIYHIEQVYIRLNDPDKEKLLEQTSIRAIYPARLSVQEFEQISHIALKGAAVL